MSIDKPQLLQIINDSISNKSKIEIEKLEYENNTLKRELQNANEIIDELQTKLGIEKKQYVCSFKVFLLYIK
jgi:FtsZ-binding cell division protein ZapB